MCKKVTVNSLYFNANCYIINLGSFFVITMLPYERRCCMSGNMGAIIWLAIAVVLFIIEGLSVQLVCIWFAVGAVASMFTSALGAPFGVQLLVFLITSIVVLLVGRPFFKKRLDLKKTATNADVVIGMEGLTLEEIDNGLQAGRVHANGLDWTARSADGSIIPARQRVMVLKIDGVKLIVEPIHEN